jgi:hypothetical protein
LFAAVLDYSVVKLQVRHNEAANAANSQTRENDRSGPRRHSPNPPESVRIERQIYFPVSPNDAAEILTPNRKDDAQVSLFWGEWPPILG